MTKNELIHEVAKAIPLGSESDEMVVEVLTAILTARLRIMKVERRQDYIYNIRLVLLSLKKELTN